MLVLVQFLLLIGLALDCLVRSLSVVFEFLIIRKRMRSQWVKYKEHTLVGELDKALKDSNNRWGMPLMGFSFKTKRGMLEEGSGKNISENSSNKYKP